MQEPRITIHMGTRQDGRGSGHVFGLRPRSKDWLEENYPDRTRVSSIYVSFDTQGGFYQIPEPILEQIFNMVTGLSLDELDEIGGFLIDNPRLGEDVYNSLEASHV